MAVNFQKRAGDDLFRPWLAYKLKKTVCFEFLDFSNVSLRKQACENELLLNRRLAPDVYLDIACLPR
ncbi:MAG: hypothetical protein COA78_15350 [Blastopirellula sp.]|nr:MAG: hypothetical protein COA78_15350 [Blastopirellula sp.]